MTEECIVCGVPCGNAFCSTGCEKSYREPVAAPVIRLPRIDPVSGFYTQVTGDINSCGHYPHECGECGHYVSCMKQ